jgi:hypothetical protein
MLATADWDSLRVARRSGAVEDAWYARTWCANLLVILRFCRLAACRSDRLKLVPTIRRWHGGLDLAGSKYYTHNMMCSTDQVTACSSPEVILMSFMC